MRLLSDQTGQNAQPTEVGARLSISYGHALASLACAVVLLAQSGSVSPEATTLVIRRMQLGVNVICVGTPG